MSKLIFENTFEESKSWLNSIMDNLYNDMAKRKDDLIREKIIEKGFGHILNGIENRRFSKIAIVKCNNWSYVYIDNSTDEGEFIVAIEDFTTKFEGAQVSIDFAWQDKIPLPLKKII